MELIFNSISNTMREKHCVREASIVARSYVCALARRFLVSQYTNRIRYGSPEKTIRSTCVLNKGIELSSLYQFGFRRWRFFFCLLRRTRTFNMKLLFITASFSYLFVQNNIRLVAGERDAIVHGSCSLKTKSSIGWHGTIDSNEIFRVHQDKANIFRCHSNQLYNGMSR